jgi:secreted trypsin-like serine protease
MFARWFWLGCVNGPGESGRGGKTGLSTWGHIELLEERTLLSDAEAIPRFHATEVAPPAQPADVVALDRIVGGTPTTGFPSVGMVGSKYYGGFFCSGTLVAPNAVLTAAHCAAFLGDTEGQFRVGGAVYKTSRVFVHPSYDPDAVGEVTANDIAVLRLATDVVGVEPSPIYRQAPTIGATLTLVGFGAGGDGANGHDGTYGVKRVGTTPIDAVKSTLIEWFFTNSSESNTAPGDSGGPAFIRTGGVYYVAGVTSGGYRPDAAFGDQSFDTRVDAYASWIDYLAAPPADDHGNRPSAATSLAFDGTGATSLDAAVDHVGDEDFFSFSPSVKTTLTVDLRADGSSLDAALAVYDDRGKLVRFNDDFDGSKDSRVQFKAKLGRTYYGRTFGHRYSTSDYELSVTPALAKSSLVAPPRDDDRVEARPAQPTRIIAERTLLVSQPADQHTRDSATASPQSPRLSQPPSTSSTSRPSSTYTPTGSILALDALLDRRLSAFDAV